ncbi:TetR family transcriptional regulator [Actinomycetospora sp. NBRC 106375]|uniref:TetR/AcrR family transcriptional regulator n=1 Tax=Actinomycetospora sp. NBRC 106375 TaxID=3032207 RepID=UPI0024A24372|nr:TetR/AcrR family transcriptional regulator [Actinomycetospora sp. NBRC 106375]GLZ43924.1 TetR family transcriptional regulator [Actinomycetospora sp. NBRC 106375]
MTEVAQESPEPVGRVARKRGRRIQQILAVAAELFGERGYDAVNLDDVAERLDVTKGSLYYYFASKDELAAAAIETLGSDWTDRLERLPAGAEGPPTARLRALIREHVAIAVREYPAALRLFLVPSTWPDALRVRITELRRRHDHVFRTVLTEGIDRGEFRVVGLGSTLQAMHAAMSQAPLWCAGLGEDEQERALDELADTLMKLVA